MYLKHIYLFYIVLKFSTRSTVVYDIRYDKSLRSNYNILEVNSYFISFSATNVIILLVYLITNLQQYLFMHHRSSLGAHYYPQVIIIRTHFHRLSRHRGWKTTIAFTVRSETNSETSRALAAQYIHWCIKSHFIKYQITVYASINYYWVSKNQWVSRWQSLFRISWLHWQTCTCVVFVCVRVLGGCCNSK